MTCLQTLRNTPWLARLALLWFALTLGVAVASPLVNPQNEVLICSAASGMVKIVLNDDGSVSSSATLDCPLCLVGLVVPPVAVSLPATVHSQVTALQSSWPDITLDVSAALPPSRGPPTLL